MAKAQEKTGAVSDPNSPHYDPNSPHYDVTADSSSQFFVGPIKDDHKSGDEIRSEVTSVVDQVAPPGTWLGELLRPVKDDLVQGAYTDRIKDARQGLADQVELREPGEAPKTLWANASHEQMVEIISSNADSAAVAVTSEEWVRLGNDLSEHQKEFGKAINDSLGNWKGDAGDAARTHLAEVAKWLGSTADGAALTGRQQEIHSQTLNETQKAMGANPPVPFSAAEANGRLAQITNPVQYAMQFSAEMETFHRNQAARDQAAQVMHRFDDTVSGAATTPKFTAPPKLPQARKQSSVMRMSQERTASRPTMATAGGLERNGMAPSGSKPIGNGTVPNGALPDGAVPNGGGVPGGPGAPGGAFSGGGVPGGVPGGGGPGGGGPGGGPGMPSMPTLPDPNTSGVSALSGSTGAAGYTPPASIPSPSVPDIPKPPTVPSGIPNVPGPGYTPPTFSTPPGSVGERTTRLPTTGPQNRPTVPNIPNGPGGRGFGPGGVPPIGGPPGGPRFGPPGSIPGVPGGGPGGGGPGSTHGSAPGGSPGGGPGNGPGSAPPGSRAGGFGPTGGGGAPGGPGAPGGGAAGARGAGAPAGGGGMGGGGAGGGQGGDQEYQVASYLEGDEELFAPGKVVSPPVIGDWQSKQDWK